MGIDLIGHGGFMINWHGWKHCLDLAREFGWQPAGPVWPEGHFEGAVHQNAEEAYQSYLSNDSQEVTDADAKRLGEALAAAADAVEQGLPLTPTQMTAAREGFENLELVALWRKLSDYCGNGGFLIG
jgi:hypothetical protein